jgi:hypothetical protein
VNDHRSDHDQELGQQTVLEALGAVQGVAEEHYRVSCELHELLGRQLAPARPKTIRLTNSEQAKTDDSKDRSRSIGVYNPTGHTVWLALEGGRPTKLGEGWRVPANALLVVPVSAEDVSIGADVVDDPNSFADGDLVVFLLRFPSPQPAFLGKAA